MYRPIKSPTSYHEQVELLKKRGIIIDDEPSCLERNRCAHYSRLYNWNFPSIPRIPQNDSFRADRSVFSQLYMLKLMYPYPDRWKNDFVKPLSSLLRKHKDSIDKSHIGFPYRWKSILSK